MAYKKPDNIPLSYSAISEFENCPFKFYNTNKYLLNRYPYQETPATAKGKRMHLAFEEYIRDGRPLPDEFKHHEYFMQKLKASAGVKTVEHKMALNWNNEQVDFFKGRGIWLRGQYDLMIKNGPTAVMIDYKTGSDKYPKLDQQQCMAMMAFHFMPDLQEVTGALIFVEKGYSTFKETFKRDNMESYISEWKGRALAVQQAHQTNSWPTRQNPLCAYCPVVECPYNKRIDTNGRT